MLINRKQHQRLNRYGQTSPMSLYCSN